MIIDKRVSNIYPVIMLISGILVLISILAFIYYFFRDPTMPVGLVTIPTWVYVVLIIGGTLMIMDLFIRPRRSY